MISIEIVCIYYILKFTKYQNLSHSYREQYDALKILSDKLDHNRVRRLSKGTPTKPILSKTNRFKRFNYKIISIIQFQKLRQDPIICLILEKIYMNMFNNFMKVCRGYAYALINLHHLLQAGM